MTCELLRRGKFSSRLLGASRLPSYMDQLEGVASEIVLSVHGFAPKSVSEPKGETLNQKFQKNPNLMVRCTGGAATVSEGKKVYQGGGRECNKTPYHHL